jgi:hypothetical protein
LSNRQLDQLYAGVFCFVDGWWEVAGISAVFGRLELEILGLTQKEYIK